MQVYKFGGASVKDDAAIKNVAAIVSASPQGLCVIVSAMGKTTNALEKLHHQWFNSLPYQETLQTIIEFHLNISEALQIEKNTSLWFRQIESLVARLEEIDKKSFDFTYDQIIPFGEIISSSLLHDYWNKISLQHQFIFATDYIITDALHREARVQWQTTEERMKKLNVERTIVLTQGFIGSTKEGAWTTLGREGSDYSAAIFAHGLNAHQLTIWKDVPGMLNADPKKHPDAKIIEKISYQEAIELAYYGASVIHPKTIQPLESKNIQLRIASFIDPSLPGTLVGRFPGIQYPSCIIEKENQTLISISTKDYSFVVEDNIVEIFNHLYQLGIKVQMMENSALSFAMCIQCENHKITALKEALTGRYNVRYNEGVKLITIRHYESRDLSRIDEKSILMEQKNRTTVRWVTN